MISDRLEMTVPRRLRGQRFVRSLAGIAVVLGSALSSVPSIAVDSNGDNVDDALVASFAAAGVQSFPESDAGSTATVSAISFSTSGSPSYSNSSLTNGSNIPAVRISDGTTVNIGTGTGTVLLGDALVWGGASLVDSGSRWIRVHRTADTSGAAACSDTQATRIVELRAVTVSPTDSVTVGIG